MRCCVLAVIVSTLWLPTCRAQEPPASMNSAAAPEKIASLPKTNIRKPLVPPALWPCWKCLHLRPEWSNVSLQSSVWPAPYHVIDRKFSLVAGMTLGSSLLVAKGTDHCRHTVGVGRCIGSDGESKATQGIQIALSGLVTGIGYWWKKSDQETHEKHPRWWVFPVVATAVNTLVAVNQFSKRCPHGTLFDGRTCRR
jgi:hypothetical protein